MHPGSIQRWSILREKKLNSSPKAASPLVSVGRQKIMFIIFALVSPLWVWNLRDSARNSCFTIRHSLIRMWTKSEEMVDLHFIRENTGSNSLLKVWKTLQISTNPLQCKDYPCPACVEVFGRKSRDFTNSVLRGAAVSSNSVRAWVLNLISKWVVGEQKRIHPLLSSGTICVNM